MHHLSYRDMAAPQSLRPVCHKNAIHILGAPPDNCVGKLVSCTHGISIDTMSDRQLLLHSSALATMYARCTHGINIDSTSDLSRLHGTGRGTTYASRAHGISPVPCPELQTGCKRPLADCERVVNVNTLGCGGVFY